MEPDAALLQRFTSNHDQEAFTGLVHRYVDLVYSAALRRTAGRHHLAADISQRVFCSLARKAASLQQHPTLVGWLYKTTRYAAIDVLRTEQRHQSAQGSEREMMMIESEPSPESAWAAVRPELDAAMDSLRERDRQLILLRYFEGRSYREVGEHLQLSENSARMGTDRALEKLRLILSRRGATSSVAILAGILSTQAIAATPAATVTAITSAALATPQAAGGLLTILVMSKLTAPIASALVAAALTTLLWKTVSADPSAEIDALRRENALLTAANASSASASDVTNAVNSFASRATAIAAAVSRALPPASSSSTAAQPRQHATTQDPSKHRNRGQATPKDALMTFTWATDASDIPALANLICFDGNGREKAAAVLANLPASLREQYKTPEELYAFLIAADALIVPPPGADVLENLVPVETAPGRVSMCRPGSSKGRHELLQTADGWKWIFPEKAVEGFANQVLSSETLLKLESDK